MSSFAYSVAIKLSVQNLASQGIRLIAGDLMSAHGVAVKLDEKLKALKLTALGYGLDKAGSGILGFLEKSVDVSKEYTRQLSLMNAAGMAQRDIAQATAAAWSTSKSVVTSSAAENLEAIRELRSVFGKDNMGEAYSILPTVMRTKATLEALTGREQKGVAFDMVKAIELRTPGTMSAERMQGNADQMSQTLMAMGGTLTVNDFHMALKQAKTSAFGLSDEFVYKLLPTFMQEVKTKEGGAMTAGTALMTAYRAVVQGVVRKASIPLWEQMGLINPADVVHNSTGQMQLKPGAVKDAQAFQANPYAWANQVLAPAIASYGAAHHLNREQVLSSMFGDRNAQWFFNTLIAKAQQFERDRKLIDSGGNSLETYSKLVKSNPQLAEQSLHKQWENIQAQVGYSILPRLIPYMIKFADGLDRLSQWMQRHPDLTTNLVLGLGATAVGFSLLGKALMTAGLIKFLGLGPAIGSAVGGIATAGGTIAKVAIGLSGSLGVVGLALNVLAVGATAWAGWKVGGLINDAVTGPKGESIGTRLYDWLHPEAPLNTPKRKVIGLGSPLLPPAAAPWRGESPGGFTADHKQRQTNITTILKVDGRELARATSKHLANGLSGRNTGTGVDAQIFPVMPALNGAG